MSTLKQRWESLKKDNGYQSDAELLREIYQYLYARSETKETEADFVRKAKGSLSYMLDEKRDFDWRYFYPLEKALHTSAVYLIEGTGEPMPESEQRGLRYAASTDTIGNYERLIEEDVLYERDEYQCTLLDYMIDHSSKIGFEYFAGKNQLPLNEVCIHQRLPYSLDLCQHSDEDLVLTMLRVCKPKTMLRYLNGYYYVEKAINPDHIDDYEKRYHQVLSTMLFSDEEIRLALADCKRIPLSIANPGVQRRDGKPLGEGVFVNYFFNLMLETWYPTVEAKEESDRAAKEMFAKAIEINHESMAAILELGYSTYRLGEHGFVYADGILVGSIAMLPVVAADMAKYFSVSALKKYEELVNQIQEFQDKITEGSDAAFVDGELRLTKRTNPDFYAFYQLMKDTQTSAVALWLDGEHKGKDRFRLPAGKQMPLSPQSDNELFRQALETLASIDSISEASLGEGKIYAFPKLTNRSFFVFENNVTGIAPMEVMVGQRYDNLAELLSLTCLSMPTYYQASGMVASIASALKAYGITKKDAKHALELMSDYYIRSTSRYDADEERGKSLIASAHDRAIWLKLYRKEIISQYK